MVRKYVCLYVCMKDYICINWLRKALVLSRCCAGCVCQCMHGMYVDVWVRTYVFMYVCMATSRCCAGCVCHCMHGMHVDVWVRTYVCMYVCMYGYI
jgi:hypothetical protein